MGPIGFSTGALALGDFRRALQILARSSADAVELSALRSAELGPLLKAIDALDLSGFAYVALHAPTDEADEDRLVDSLGDAAIRGLNIVVHPDSIRRPELWVTVGERLCIENMDSRKPTGRTAAELRPLFRRLPAARLCFDIGHARQVDPTMVEAVRILREFGPRMSHLHVSEVDSVGVHHRISLASRLAFEEIVPQLRWDLPVIIESPVDEETLNREMEVVKRVLAPRVPVRAA